MQVCMHVYLYSYMYSKKLYLFCAYVRFLVRAVVIRANSKEIENIIIGEMYIHMVFVCVDIGAYPSVLLFVRDFPNV